MRKLGIPFAIAALVSTVWLIIKASEGVQIQVPATTPVVVAPEDGSTATEGAPAIVGVGAPAASAAFFEPPVLFPHQVPVTPITKALDDLQMPTMPEMLQTERAFAVERVDPAWASATEGHILGEIARTNSLQLVTLQVECRTSMCRVQLVHRQSQGAEPGIVFPSVGSGRLAGDAQVGAFTDLVAGLNLDARFVASAVDENATRTSLAYVARREPPP